MAVEGLKRIYETPFIKARVDIVKEHQEEGEKKQKKKQKKRFTEVKEEKKTQKKGIIDIRA